MKKKLFKLSAILMVMLCLGMTPISNVIPGTMQEVEAVAAAPEIAPRLPKAVVIAYSQPSLLPQTYEYREYIPAYGCWYSGTLSLLSYSGIYSGIFSGRTIATFYGYIYPEPQL